MNHITASELDEANTDSWAALLMVDGHEMVMRDTKEEILRKLWGWGANEVEILWESGNKYMNLRRGEAWDSDGCCLWEGFICQEGTTFGRPGWMVMRHYVPTDLNGVRYEERSFPVYQSYAPTGMGLV